MEEDKRVVFIKKGELFCWGWRGRNNDMIVYGLNKKYFKERICEFKLWCVLKGIVFCWIFFMDLEI